MDRVPEARSGPFLHSGGCSPRREISVTQCTGQAAAEIRRQIRGYGAAHRWPQSDRGAWMRSRRRVGLAHRLLGTVIGAIGLGRIVWLTTRLLERRNLGFLAITLKIGFGVREARNPIGRVGDTWIGGGGVC